MIDMSPKVRDYISERGFRGLGMVEVEWGEGEVTELVGRN